MAALTFRGLTRMNKLDNLSAQLEGELHHDRLMRVAYATDASAYRELPLAVAIPRSVEDIRRLITFARAEGTSLIPRTAGTSLAGQVVGQGIVVDVSRYFNNILELDVPGKKVRVQPGGDAVRGADLVVTAMAEGRHAAQGIMDYLGVASALPH